MKPIAFPLLEIAWVDSYGKDGWNEIEEITKEVPIECRTVGFLVRETVKAVHLVGSVGLGGDESTKGVSVCEGHMVIPKCSIIGRRNLK